jgi:hypothetical protein
VTMAGKTTWVVQVERQADAPTLWEDVWRIKAPTRMQRRTLLRHALSAGKVQAGDTARVLDESSAKERAVENQTTLIEEL